MEFVFEYLVLHNYQIKVKGVHPIVSLSQMVAHIMLVGRISISATCRLLDLVKAELVLAVATCVFSALSNLAYADQGHPFAFAAS